MEHSSLCCMRNGDRCPSTTGAHEGWMQSDLQKGLNLSLSCWIFCSKWTLLVCLHFYCIVIFGAVAAIISWHIMIQKYGSPGWQKDTGTCRMRGELVPGLDAKFIISTLMPRGPKCQCFQTQSSSRLTIQKWSSPEIVQVHPENLAFWTQSWRFGSRWFSFFNNGWYLDGSFSRQYVATLFLCVCVCLGWSPLLHLAVCLTSASNAWISSIFYFQRRSCSSACYTPRRWWSYDLPDVSTMVTSESFILLKCLFEKTSFRGQGSLAHPSVSNI